MINLKIHLRLEYKITLYKKNKKLIYIFLMF